MSARQASELRRIVTSVDESGKSSVWIDAPATNSRSPNEFTTSTLMWATDQTPAPYTGDEDAGSRVLGTAPPANGTRFTVIEFQPGGHVPPQHRTDTLDYVICIAGEITMTIDDGEVKMRAGDVMIQRGTNHAWANQGEVPARVAFVLIDGEPKREGSLHGNASAR